MGPVGAIGGGVGRVGRIGVGPGDTPGPGGVPEVPTRSTLITGMVGSIENRYGSPVDKQASFYLKLLLTKGLRPKGRTFPF